MNETEERIPIGDGWTRDKSGSVFDESGMRWYGQVVSTDQQIITKPEEAPIIQDPGTGRQNVIRVFQIKHPPGVPIAPGEIVYKTIEPFIKAGLYKSGLTTDENYKPRIFQSGKMTFITLICVPTNRRVTIYDSIKDGEGTLDYSSGTPVIVHKTDNINDLLALASSQKTETKNKK